MRFFRARYRDIAITGLAAATILIAQGGSVVAAPPALPQANQAAPHAPTLRLWGDRAMTNVLAALENAFRATHPGVAFDNHLLGTDTAMAGLYTGVADIAFMGRTATSKEIMGFEWVFQTKPQSIEVMTGPASGAGRSAALAVFVHKDNPLLKISLTQLEAIFSCERRRGAPKISTWGDLGVAGSWASHPIHAYTFDAESGTGRFFQSVVLDDSRKWAWQRVREFKQRDPFSDRDDTSREILAALASDRYGIAVANLGGSNPGIKPLALSSNASGAFVTPSSVENSSARAYALANENLVSGAYPLARHLYAYFNRAPGKPIDSDIAAFLQFIVSREGQEIVKRQTDFLPLSGADAAASTHALE